MKTLTTFNNKYKAIQKNKKINITYLNKICKNHKNKMNKFQK